MADVCVRQTWVSSGWRSVVELSTSSTRLGLSENTPSLRAFVQPHPLCYSSQRNKAPSTSLHLLARTPFDEMSSLLCDTIYTTKAHLRRSWPFHGGELLRLLGMLIEWKAKGGLGGEPREVTNWLVGRSLVGLPAADIMVPYTAVSVSHEHRNYEYLLSVSEFRHSLLLLNMEVPYTILTTYRTCRVDL